MINRREFFNTVGLGIGASILSPIISDKLFASKPLLRKDDIKHFLSTNPEDKMALLLNNQELYNKVMLPKTNMPINNIDYFNRTFPHMINRIFENFVKKDNFYVMQYHATYDKNNNLIVADEYKLKCLWYIRNTCFGILSEGNINDSYENNMIALCKQNFSDLFKYNKEIYMYLPFQININSSYISTMFGSIKETHD